ASGSSGIGNTVRTPASPCFGKGTIWVSRCTEWPLRRDGGRGPLRLSTHESSVLDQAARTQSSALLRHRDGAPSPVLANAVGATCPHSPPGSPGVTWHP